MSRSRRFIVKRLAYLPLAVLLVVTLSFVLVNLAPGDAVRAQLTGQTSEAGIQRIRHELDLDQPIWRRYVQYLGDLSHGDLGTSWVSKRSVAAEIRQTLPNSLELIGMSLALAVTVGTAVGAIGAAFHGRLLDITARTAISLLQSIPDFFLGLVLIVLFFYHLGWVPAPTGRIDMFESPPSTITGGLITDALLTGHWRLALSGLRHSILPVATLGLASSAYFAKVSRATLISVLESRQIEYARALGLRPWTVWSYALREARTPILTYGAILMASMVGGAALIETVFSWGGMGQWAVEHVLAHDQPAIQGFVLVTGLFTLAIYVTLEVVIAWLDPRISMAEK